MPFASPPPRTPQSGLPPGRDRAAKSALLALLLLAAGAGQAFAQNDNFSFQDLQLNGTFGLQYSNGDYGTTRNTSVLIGLPTLGVETGDFQFNLSMPYMRISGRGLVLFDAAGNPIVVNRRTSLPPAVRTGFGDLNLSATYTVPKDVLDDFEVKLTAGTKLPTASARRRLSTGETDFSLSADISRQFGAWGPFLTVGYLLPGKPAAFKLYNTTSMSAGTSLELSDNLVAVASYDFDSASTPLVAASHELFGSLSWIRDNGLTLTGYGTVGLSTGSPDIGAGLLVSYGLN
jgi:hypothetical protein